MLAPALALVAAIVTYDQTPLRAAPHDAAPKQAVLWRGDWLEVRGERLGFVQVYDHRHERPGWVRPWQVRPYPVEESTAPSLHAVVEFLRDTPGAESLGIGHVALLLRASPAGADLTPAFDALGTMADRLGRVASQRRGTPTDAALAAHLEVAETYGVRFVSFEREGRTRLCYDGEAFRRVLALGGTQVQRARAALALTRGDCLDPNIAPALAQTVDEWRAEILARVDAGTTPAGLANRVRLRRAEVDAQLAYRRARRGDGSGAAKNSANAVRELALVDRAELSDDDLASYEETAVRVAAARWPSEPARPLAGALTLETANRRPGETCLRLLEKGRVAAERCTYGLPWIASARAAPRGNLLTIAVQPLAGWVELWVFRRARDAWQVDALAPAAVDPDLGYVEAAGFSPDGTRLLVVREAREPEGMRRIFQLLRADALTVEKEARNPDVLLSFRRWHAPDWRTRTLALR